MNHVPESVQGEPSGEGDMGGDQGKPTIVLLPAGQRGFRMPGTVVATASCGHLAAMAPSTVEFLATVDGAGSTTICTECFAGSDISDCRTGLVPGVNTEMVSVFGLTRPPP